MALFILGLERDLHNARPTVGDDKETKQICRLFEKTIDSTCT